VAVAEIFEKGHSLNVSKIQKPPGFFAILQYYWAMDYFMPKRKIKGPDSMFASISGAK
jgi:hypothetical protein